VAGWLAVALAALALGMPALAGASEGPSRAQVEKLVVDWLKAWENGDLNLLESTLHPQILFAYPAVRTDYAGTVREFEIFHRDFRDTKVYVHQILVDGARFAAEYQFATTRNSNGRRQAAGTIAIGTVRDGRIDLVKEYVDGRVSRMQEKGELPLDEASEPFPWPLVPPKAPSVPAPGDPTTATPAPATAE
jgi:ketosteroid isomerase-like protein